MVANLYRMDLIRRRDWSEELFHDLATAFRATVELFERGAWVGGKSGEVTMDLEGFQSMMRMMIGSIRMQYEEAIAREPYLVEDYMPQAHWQPR